VKTGVKMDLDRDYLGDGRMEKGNISHPPFTLA
jgi:hypothetical protein